ncbi:tetratricopeptide repeat protein [Thiorhodovibrio winogradskyi]|nr:tetratricopeptide repeat protein [Thiorhodovibrio winogradskyi]
MSPQRFLPLIVLLLAASVEAAPVIGAALQAPLQQVIRHLEQNRPAAAIDALRDLQQRQPLSHYEQASLQRFLGQAYFQGEQPELAIQAFEQSLASEALTRAEQQDIRYLLGQLYLKQDRPRLAIEQLRGLDPGDYPRAASYLWRAQTATGAHDEAIATAQRLLQGKSRPAPDDINHLLALYRQAERPEPARALAREAVGWYPAERRYWQELARLQLQLGEKRAAAATLQTMERLGLALTAQERDRLIRLYLHLDAPLKAAELLEQGLADGDPRNNAQHRARLAAAWLQARAWQQAERELEALVAEQPRTDPDRLADLAYCHYQQGHWNQAIANYRQALAAGRPADPGRAWLLLGIAAIKAKDGDTAQAALQEAEAYPRQHQQANQWLSFLRLQPDLNRESAVDASDGRLAGRG